jgi:DNA recombination protein RmuC
VGKGITTAQNSYNDAMASLESRVLVSARKFKELGATSQEAEIIELRAVEGGSRRVHQGSLLPDKHDD